MNVNADIVFGDPWGMSGVDWQNGDSVIITRTEKGQGIVDEMIGSNQLLLSKGNLDELIIGQLIPQRLINVDKELREKTYLKRFMSSENKLCNSDEVIAYARTYVEKNLKKKSILYRVARKLYKLYYLFINKIR